MYFPTPIELAEAITHTSYTDDEKRRITNSIQYMNQGQVSELYEDLLELHAIEQQYMARVEKIDLKYKVECRY